MNSVVHFEMPYEDRDRAAEFYSKAFGWQNQKYGQEMGNYMVMVTTEMDEATKQPKKPGAINGGMYQKPKDGPSAPSFVIAVDDIHAAIQKVKDAGGTVLGAMTGDVDDIPGVGLYCSFRDTEGNRVSILQPKSM